VKTLAEIEQRLNELAGCGGPDPESAAVVLSLGETVLEHWVRAQGVEPTNDLREGFRLLALHRQGCLGQPSFNACRETCRELVYHYNLITMEPAHENSTRRFRMMVLLASHLCLFVAGKMQVAELGDFCCSSRPVREDAARIDNASGG
jgi:hypothetical protein